VKGAREVLEALEKKYSFERAGSETYIVDRFLEFKMVDENQC